MPGVTDHYQLSVAASSEQEAKRLAQLVVSQRLAACAQVLGPITSTYWWEGRVESAEEWLCLVKTAADRVDAAIAAVRAAHSYDTPEIVALPIAAGDRDYLAWVTYETRPGGLGEL
jgi:periplasmic divalent cation tolerance protein